MSKILSIILLSLLSIFGIQNEQIYLESNLPAAIQPGGTYTVEIIIHKKDLQKYATLTQKLPKGITAKENLSGAADFSFNNQELKYTWLRLPKDSDITLTYDIVVDKNVKPQVYNLSTKFVYIYKNLRGSVNLKNSQVKIQHKVVKPLKKEKPQVIRSKPQYSPMKKALFVYINVDKGNLSGEAKISESIPLGYKVRAIDKQGAKFQVNKDRVEFIWTELPKKKNFVVVYLLSPHKSEKSPLPNISGKFMYWKNNSLEYKVINQEGKSDNIDTEVEEFFRN